ncbi:MAG: hypothetical protein PWR12_359 [Eubacteriaceae bacterium]|jgi:hypothetical protein|nr:hypothetical protein [Eubacteriaceae bacterium]MDK2904283.1 hypothetical protein [Eubacteriaceae bacterium]MDK2936482.1 hypothetical protein [Eubacteriaceae bacterium]
MHGPIDFIVMEFGEKNFKGEVLEALNDSVDKKIISVLDLALIHKDVDGNISTFDLNSLDGKLAQSIEGLHRESIGLITDEDIEEVGAIMDPDFTAGLLIVEQLWAKNLKQALMNTEGILLSEGRIHPDAAFELDEEEN